MSTPLPRSLQTLLDIGIVQSAVSDRADPLAPVPIRDGPAALSGSLAASNPVVPIPPRFVAPRPNAPNGPDAAPATQPPLFWKAIGLCLKSKFTSSGSLSDDHRAIFFGDPGQLGVLEGLGCPPEVTNYQLFTYGDIMQRVNFPTFRLSGRSYFDFVDLYLENVGEENESPELVQSRENLIAAKGRKDTVFRSHLQAQSSKTNNSLIDAIRSKGNYSAAWQAEKTAQQALADLRAPSLSSASAQLEVVRLADMRLEPQKGNNMPVITVDQDWLQMALHDPNHSIKDLVDPTTVFYQPLYTLPFYEVTTDYWIKASVASTDMVRDGPYQIPLANVWDRLWADLGHPLLDQAKPHERLTDDQKKFINSLSATLTFIQKPYAGNVSRGLWDVSDIRSMFPLQPNAPKSVKNPVCKTSKLILTWGIEIELTIPEVISLDEIANTTLAIMDLPLKRVAGSSNKLVFSAGNDGFPILMGALADVV